jgi:5-methylcytosine-specific restriction endonuclease McrA
MKRCWKCSTFKLTTEFVKNKSKKDGLSSECKECKRTQDKEYGFKNKQVIQARASAWYYDNYEHARKIRNEYSRQWIVNNPDKNTAKSNLYRARKLNASPSWLTNEQKSQIDSIYWLARLQQELNDEQYHVDHIVPLKGKTVCGLHVPWNLQILSAKKNMTKGNRLNAYI